MSGSPTGLFLLALVLGCGGRSGQTTISGNEGEGEAEAEIEADGSVADDGATDGSAANGPVMVDVPGGAFSMGCNSETDELCEGDEQPIHDVMLPAYRIDQTEVTVGAYTACVDAGGCDPPGQGGGVCTWGGAGLEEYPLNCVDWQEANHYCAWAGGRLPTEAEWEKAARGTEGRIFPWGDSEPTCSIVAAGVDETCNLSYPEPVGSHPDGASPYGALDMAGNVSEWVSDWYDERYYDSSLANDPQGPLSGALRLTRGGSVFSGRTNLRASDRRAVDPAERSVENGFRCAADR